MSMPYVLTETEEDLLDFARRVLGRNLSEFLLAGLGEPHHIHRRYTTTSIRAHRLGIPYKLEAISDNEKGLPGGCDPLVMAAMLHLLWTGERGRDEVVFRDEILLEKLSWPDTQKLRFSVEAAIERYYCTAYHRASREPLGPGRGERVSAQVQKLVPGYDTTVELRVGPLKEMRKSTVVHFTTKLVEEVSGTEKYFLGIDFERLGPLKLLSPEVT